jgi:TPR repeat protein
LPQGKARQLLLQGRGRAGCRRTKRRRHGCSGRRPTSKGFSNAQCDLGVCYTRAEGMPQDKAQVARLYRQTTDQDFAAAQCNLGTCYNKGEGVPQHKAQAARLYRQAADQGLANAQFELGICYEHGKGVRYDVGRRGSGPLSTCDPGGDAQTRMRTLGCALRRGEGCRATAPRPSACTSSRRAVAPRMLSQAHSLVL